MKTTLLWLIAVLVLPATLAAQIEPKSRPPSSTPPPDGGVRAPSGRLRIEGRVDVGEAAPGFELTSAKGERVRLSRYRGDQVLLAFADRREAFSPFRAVAESLRTMGVLLVGVCHGSPRSLRALAERDSLRFDLLSDPTGEVAAIYGAYDFATSTTRPGYVLVGRRGKVRMALLGQPLRPNDLLQITRYVLIGS
jgi:peroxiredoxin